MQDFSFAAVFSDHCVLQRGKDIALFGTAADGAEIELSLSGADGMQLAQNSTIARNGRWELFLPPQSAQDGCTVRAECHAGGTTETRVLQDIAIGEVWLAGGQSNMEFELQNCTEGPAELADSEGNGGGKQVRFYYTNKIGWMDKAFYEAERKTCWQTWQSEAKKSWSAVGYFFARKLAKDLGVTVGVIGCNWGGTSASAWMRREYLEKDADLSCYLSEYEEALRGKSVEQQCAEYDAYEQENNVWQEKFARMFEKDKNLTWETAEKVLGKCPWPGPKSCKNPYRPTGLYDCMVARILPYTLRGVIWYQGESDDHKPASYRKLFTALIENWRADWHDPALPFVFVQLPNHRYQADKDFKHWCIIREAQQQVHDSVRNAWMSCALDKGQFSDIHPKAKQEVGERLERNALANVYKKAAPDEALSPMLESSRAEKGRMVLRFRHAGGGFCLRDDAQVLAEYKEMERRQGNTVPAEFTGFELAGIDGVFHPAAFAFGTEDGKASITLSSPQVSRPLSARYAWFNYGPVTVFGANGLPLAPFRTDSGQPAQESGHAAIQQIMTVG